MTDEEQIAREAAESITRVKQYHDSSSYFVEVSRWEDDGEIDTIIQHKGGAEADCQRLRDLLTDTIQTAIEKARCAYPVPSPVSEERLESATERLEKCGGHNYGGAVTRQQADDILAHIDYQNLLISWLASDQRDTDAYRRLEEIAKKGGEG